MGIFDRLSAWGERNRGGEEPSAIEENLRAELKAVADDPTAAERPLRYAMRWTGQVQGVGFRYTHTNIASKYGLTGWVENLDDGSVRMEIQGCAAELLKHLAELHESYERMGTRFRLQSAEALPLCAGENSFEPRY